MLHEAKTQKHLFDVDRKQDQFKKNCYELVKCMYGHFS